MNLTKIAKEDMDFPRRELFNGDLEIVVAFSICPGINFLCVYTRGPIQLYIEPLCRLYQQTNVLNKTEDFHSCVEGRRPQDTPQFCNF